MLLHVSDTHRPPRAINTMDALVDNLADIQTMLDRLPDDPQPPTGSRLWRLAFAAAAVVVAIYWANVLWPLFTL